MYRKLIKFLPQSLKRSIKLFFNKVFNLINFFKTLFLMGLNQTLSRFDLELSKKSKAHNRPGLNINVGCGEYKIADFVSVDFYSAHYYEGVKFNGVHYDMRNDNLPFTDESVNVIYCSHVIEHIESLHVEHFISESYRVLKNNGILRVVCPDSLFLYEQLRDFPEYWNWHPFYKVPEDALRCFIDYVATHVLKLEKFGLDKEIWQYSYSDLMAKLRIGGVFDQSDPGRHINNFDFERLERMGYLAGFYKVVQSRAKGSSHPNLQGFDMDLTHPAMSLYVDFVKNI
jgi:predicted SAM-dependent methyltransferase